MPAAHRHRHDLDAEPPLRKPRQQHRPDASAMQRRAQVAVDVDPYAHDAATALVDLEAEPARVDAATPTCAEDRERRGALEVVRRIGIPYPDLARPRVGLPALVHLAPVLERALVQVDRHLLALAGPERHPLEPGERTPRLLHSGY